MHVDAPRSGVHEERVRGATLLILERATAYARSVRDQNALPAPGSGFAFLIGATVHQVWIWGPVRLVLEYDGRPTSGVKVDVWRAELVAADGTSSLIDFNADPVLSRAVVGLWQKRIAQAAEDGGVLTLSFDSGELLRALPDDRYESWNVVDAGGHVYQCLPGGELLEY